MEHVQRRRGRQLGRRRRRRRRGLSGALQARLRIPRRVSGRRPVLLLQVMVLQAAVVESGLLGHASERSVRRRSDREVAAGRRGQRRTVRRPGAAVKTSGAARRIGRGRRLVVGTLGHASVPVRFVNVVIIFHDGHHESHGSGVS